MPFTETWMDLNNIILSEVSKKEKGHMILFTCGVQNTTQMNLSKYKTETDLQTQKADSWL